ncbi:MAG: hypothetical protein EOO56_07510 [Hymenobacter sp.]|nr:MAG: hypothetical protein EOO56_07510 [Hymenobacter sp.]
MSKPAAALGDIAAHGGVIVLGSFNVFIGGRPAARQGDSITCPLHGTGVISQGSASVFINGMPAARLGDITGCMMMGLAAISVPAVLGPPPVAASPIEWAGSFAPKKNGKFHEQNDQERGGTSALHAETHITDTDKDGTRDNVSVAAELLRMRNNGVLSPPSVDIPFFGKMEVYGTHSEDIVYGSAQASANVTHFGGSASGMAEAGLSKSSSSISISPVGDKGKNPFVSIGQEVNLMHAKGEADLLVGSDSNRVGLGGGYTYGAEALSTETTYIGTLPAGSTYNAQAIFKKSFSWGATPEVGGGGWLYYDKSKQRLFARIKGKVAAFFKVGGELEISMGVRFHDDPPPAPAAPAKPAKPAFSYLNTPGFGPSGIPGTIMLGNFRVMIG